jgi:hypothetical protein
MQYLPHGRKEYRRMNQMKEEEAEEEEEKEEEKESIC